MTHHQALSPSKRLPWTCADRQPIYRQPMHRQPIQMTKVGIHRTASARHRLNNYTLYKIDNLARSNYVHELADSKSRFHKILRPMRRFLARPLSSHYSRVRGVFSLSALFVDQNLDAHRVMPPNQPTATGTLSIRSFSFSPIHPIPRHLHHLQLVFSLPLLGGIHPRRC
jgi:hypothetical protein